MADRDGQVCGITFPLARRAWCQATHVASNASLTYLSPGAVLYPSATQGLFAFDPATGRQLAVWKPKSAEGAWATTGARPTVARGGSAVYLTDVSGNVRKIEARVQQLD